MDCFSTCYSLQSRRFQVKRETSDKSIGIIIKDITYPFYTAIAKGVSEYANSKGYSVIVSSSDDSNEWEKNLSRLFTTKDINGIIIAPMVEGTAEIEHLVKLEMINYPFVLLEDVKGILANVVAIDNRRAIKRAVKYLIDSGHKKIVHFAGPPQSAHTQERMEGFRYAFGESTLVFNNDMIISVGSHFKECFDKAVDYFKNRNRDNYPTAIVCFNDQQALAVMLVLKELNGLLPRATKIPPTGAIRSPLYEAVGPPLQVLHVLIVLLIETRHVFGDGHLSIPDRGSSFIKGALVERVQKLTPVLRIVRLRQ